MGCVSGKHTAGAGKGGRVDAAAAAAAGCPAGSPATKTLLAGRWAGDVNPSAGEPLAAAEKATASAEATSSGGSVCLRRARTTTLKKKNVDVSVRKYLCRDSSVLGALGKHCRESRWLVRADGAEKPLEVVLRVDQGLIMGTDVTVTCNGATIYPAAGASQRQMREDFVHSWPFRGVLAKGLGVRGFFEVQPPSRRGPTLPWFEATVTAQRDDGLFEVTALMPDGQGTLHEMSYPAINAELLRERLTGRPPQRAERTLVLRVPHAKPLAATLQLDGEDITRHFARPTPPPPPSPPLPSQPTAGSGSTKGAAGVTFQLDATRSHLTADVGHAALSWYLAGEPRQAGADAEKHRASWTLQLGPFARHRVELESCYGSRILTLTVDGEPLVEATAEDLCCDGTWHCDFRLCGERRLDFHMHETDQDGNTLPSRGKSTVRSRISQACSVTLEDEQDFRTATLWVGDLPFEELEQGREAHVEEVLSTSPAAFRLTYGLVVPYVVNDEAPTGAAAVLAGLRAAPQCPGWLSFLEACRGEGAAAGAETEVSVCPPQGRRP